MGSLCFIALLLMCWPGMQGEIIAFDCADPATEVSRVSLLRVKPCADPKDATEKVNRRIQLIQERQYTDVHVYTCLVAIQQLIEHCGMHSHTSAVAGGLANYVHYVKGEACKNAHRYQRLDLTGIGAGVIAGLTLNGTTSVSVTLEGYLEPSGKCQGVRFTQNGVNYEDVIVNAAITIKLHDYTALANVEANILNLPSGTACPYSEKYCFDDMVGETVWEANPQEQCSATGMDVLYEGMATLLIINGTDGQPTTRFVIVETQDVVFALRLQVMENMCHEQAWRTEQTRLLVIFESSAGFYYRKERRLMANTDLMAQVLSKLLFLEIALRQQMKEQLYESIRRRCELREKLLRNRLVLASQSPEATADLVRETTGHLGRVVGEVLYIVRCSPKIVEFRKADYCYQELPITYKNQSKFMTATNHVIQDHGTQVDCDRRLPPAFYVENTWIELSPDLRPLHPPPAELNPNVELSNLPMMKISPISSSGIYTRQDKEAFQHSLMFPTERKAVTNLVTRRVTGGVVDPQGYHLPKLFSSTEFSGMAFQAAREVWGILSTLGNVFSVCTFIYAVVSLLSYVLNVGMNCKTLRKASAHRERRPWFFWASLWQPLFSRYVVDLMQGAARRADDRRTHTPATPDTTMAVQGTPASAPRPGATPDDCGARNEVADVSVLRHPIV